MAEKRKLTGFWNVDRVLHECLRFSDDRGYIKVAGHSDDSPYSIKERRFVAVMKAYGKEEVFNHGIGYLISETCSNDKINKLEMFLRQNLGDKHSPVLTNPDLLKSVRYRKDLFEALFSYRKSLYRIEDFWSGVMECSHAVALAYRLTNNLNQLHIKFVSDVIDRMLVLLMGDDYDKSFSEEELLPFGYPDVTDKELEDMIFDNW